MFSKFLSSSKPALEKLLEELLKRYEYASILGTDYHIKNYVVRKTVTSVSDGPGTERGFVVRLNNGRSFFDYYFDSIPEDIGEIVKAIEGAVKLGEGLSDRQISPKAVLDEPLQKDFYRENDLADYKTEDIVSFLTSLKDQVLARSDKVKDAFAVISTLETSKIFLSRSRRLTQNYVWVNGMLRIAYSDNNRMVGSRTGANSHLLKDVFENLPKTIDELLDKAAHLITAKPIVPGVYDIITHPSITGLIAHEAFGHGVEMDQFVKDRAVAKEYVGKYVASPLINMHDGASATLSAASYFFDDDGVLASDTLIIKDGILQTGICDLVSSRELGTNPTGNGRRQSYRNKAYTRMTNTFFDEGESKVEDMIASIKHGYMLFETNNGMEDPKNWAIQCVCEYGREIIDGKLTDNYVSPVVISGFVLDLLKSISMVSKGKEIIGAGQCGKGYKEWVRVSDGGPYLKARAKLS
ncbi:MAG: TldD/PmbA family protein [Bacilli bacterium]|nr:TldD/PmbA family protein [Bacilli bacterium]